MRSDSLDPAPQPGKGNEQNKFSVDYDVLFNMTWTQGKLERWQDGRALASNVLNMFIDIQTSKELIQMDTDKMMTYETFTMDDENHTQS